MSRAPQPVEKLGIAVESPGGARRGIVWMGCGALCNWGAVGNRWDWIVGVLLAAAPAASAGGGQASGGQDGPPTRPAESKPAAATRPAPQGDGPLAAAMRFLELERYDDAAALLEKQVATNPKDVEALALLGTARVQLHQYEEGRAAFAKILAITPDDARAMIGLADALEKLGNLDEAAAWLDRAIAKDPKRVEGLFAGGQLAARRHENAKAKDLLARALAIEPWGYLSPAAHYALSQIAVAEGNAADAKKERDLYKRTFQWAERRSALEKRLAVEPNDASARRALATLYREAGDGKSSLALLDPLARAFPKDAKLRIEISESLAIVGDRKGAAAAVGEALRIDPNYVGSYRQAAHLALVAGDLPLALSSLEKALDLDPAASAEPALRELLVALVDKATAAKKPKIAERAASLKKRLGD